MVIGYDSTFLNSNDWWTSSHRIETPAPLRLDEPETQSDKLSKLCTCWTTFMSHRFIVPKPQLREKPIINKQRNRKKASFTCWLLIAWSIMPGYEHGNASADDVEPGLVLLQRRPEVLQLDIMSTHPHLHLQTRGCRLQRRRCDGVHSWVWISEWRALGCPAGLESCSLYRAVVMFVGCVSW